MAFDWLAAIDDAIHLPKRKLSTVLFANLCEVGWFVRQEIELHHDPFPFATQSVADYAMLTKLTLAGGDDFCVLGKTGRCPQHDCQYNPSQATVFFPLS